MSATANPHFAFYQCQSTGCRLRFPAEERGNAALTCPLCGTPTAQVAGAVLSSRTTTDKSPTRASAELVAVLDNIRSAYNVGAMFRTADGAGFRHLYLCGVTATPQHRRVDKTALGASAHVPWSHHRNTLDLVIQLRAEGYEIWSLENSGQGISIFDAPAPSGRCAVVVGNERAGIDPGVLAQSDSIWSLPMAGHKSSLNVEVAFGVAVYYLQFGHSARGSA